MTHVRTKIRKAVVKLINSMSDIDAFDNLARKPNVEELPVVSVRTPEETSTRYSKDEDLQRTLKIVLTFMVCATFDEPQDILDKYAAKAEKLMDDDDLDGLLFDEPELIKTELEVFEEGKEKIAFLHMEYLVEYQTSEGNAEAVA